MGKIAFISTLLLFLATDVLYSQDFTVTAPYTSLTRNTCGQFVDCAGSSADDHQYAVTIPSPGTWVFSLCGSSYDTYMTVGTTLCAADVGVNDDACGVQSEVVATLAAGVYHVTIDGFLTSCGDYVLDVSQQVPVGPEDDCGGAILLNCGDIVNGTTTGYNADVMPFCGTTDGTGGGVWYSITGTGNAITASLCGSTYDTKIRVFSGICSALICVAGNDDNCLTQSEVTWTSTLGATYFILVHGFGGDEGDFILSITCSGPPSPACFQVNPIPYLPYAYAGTSVTLTDDVHSGVVNIGFDFCFMGNTYNQCVISSNNYITFNLAMAGQYSQFTTVAAPTAAPAEVRNAVLGPWQDINPATGGNIYYQTIGAAPDRVFVVSYDAIPMFSCTDQIYSSQIILMEGSNCIQTVITEKPVCPTWNDGNAVYATNNAAGNSGAIYAGRNNTQWTALDEGTVWTPNCGPCLTATSDLCLTTVLPVELLDFSGRSDKVNVHLDWQTASEVNNDYFTLERSSDGVNFEFIGRLDGQGNSSVASGYVFTDQGAHRGTNYYRLSQTDFDGASETFDVIAIEHNGSSSFELYPNPAQSLLSLKLPELPDLGTRLQLYNADGRQVFEQFVTAQTTSIDISKLPDGVYYVMLQSMHSSEVTLFTKE